MNVVASPPSPRMPYHNSIPYRDVSPRRQHSPVYPIAADRPSSPRSPRSPHSFTYPVSSPYPNSAAPDIYSPTSTNFTGILSKHGKLSPEDLGPSVFSGSLPAEVYDCILDHLQLLHTSPNSEGCTTCYMRDLYSLTLTSRAWEKAARNKLYTKIHLHGCDSPAQLKKYRLKRGSRLRLLRRTLRARKTLANLVHELRVPELDVPIMHGKQNAVLQEYRDLVASVVMVCPNIERLFGLTLPYTHEFDRLSYALSTRKKLKEHAWIIAENSEVTERSKQRSTDILDQTQVYQFLNYHVSWSNLETLVLHSLDSTGVLEHGVFLRMFNFLPSLRHLSVSGFDAADFTDRTLLFLPPLHSLRLEGLRGVTENGLAHYASRPEAREMTSLALIEQNITSLLIISKILASLRCLERFSICQANTAPTLPEGGMVFQPSLASSTLKFLHWDVASPNLASALSQLDSGSVSQAGKNGNTPNSHLAQSILHAGFPSLKQLRAPLDIDPIGALQTVCRPARNAQVMIPPDRYSLPRSSHGSLSKRPLAMPGGDNLTSARIRAQTLIDKASKDNEAGMKVVVTDHSNSSPNISTFLDSSSEKEGTDTHNTPDNPKTPRKKQSSRQSPAAIKVNEFNLPAYIGRIGASTNDQMDASNPRFKVHPDIPGCDAEGGLVTWKHFLAANQTYTYLPPSPQSTIVARAHTAPPTPDEVTSPSSSSRFALWGSSSNSNTMGSGTSKPGSALPSPRTPSSPTKPMPSPLASSNPNDMPFWARDTCNGSWNQNQRQGKDWWLHVERERVGSRNSASMVTAARLF